MYLCLRNTQGRIDYKSTEGLHVRGDDKSKLVIKQYKTKQIIQEENQQKIIKLNWLPNWIT